MKYSLIVLLLLVSWIGASAQQTQPVNRESQRYVITKYEHTASPYILYLDTATGNLKLINWNEVTSKTKIIDFDGCPNIDASQSYNGRFSLTSTKSGGWDTFFLTDNKTGDVWQMNKGLSQHTLVKIISGEN